MEILPRTLRGLLFFWSITLTVAFTVAALSPLPRRPLNLSCRWCLPAALLVSYSLGLSAALLDPTGYARSIVFFALAGVLALIALMAPSSERLAITALFAILVAGMAGLYEYARNDWTPQLDLAREPLIVEGRINRYIEDSARGGFYYYVPVETLLQAGLASATGYYDVRIYAIARSVMVAVTALAFIALAPRLGPPAALAGLGIVLGTQLSFQGRPISFPYALLYTVVLLAGWRRAAGRALAVAAVLLAVFAHPTGPIAVIILLSALLLVASLPRVAAEKDLAGPARSGLLLTLALSLSYWFLTTFYSILVRKVTGLAESLQTFLSTVLGVTTAEGGGGGGGLTATVAPGYSNPAFHEFSIVWALTVAVPASVLLVSLFHTVRGRRLDALQTLSAAAALGSLASFGVAFLQYMATSAAGQYLIPVGQFLAAASLPGLVYEARGRAPGLLVLGILAFGAAMGAYTPDWAPLEHPDFEVAVTLKREPVYYEVGVLRDKIPKYIITYFDYDFILRPSQYKDVRKAILLLQAGEVKACSMARDPFVLFGLTAKRATAGLEGYASKVYESDLHRIYLVRPCRGRP